MEERRKRRQAAKKKRQRRAIGCFAWTVLLILTAAGLIISRVLGGPGRTDTRLHANPYGPADFAMMGGYLTCTAGPARLGVDVSAHQGPIDWEQVRGAGFDFAFIRIGYRGYSVGNIYSDERARENLAAARAAGLDVGVYFYAQAISPDEAREEARWCLDFLGGEPLDLPVVYDWEYVSPSARTGSMDRTTLTECVNVFCDTIAQEGYRGMVYFNPHVAQDLLDLKALEDHPWWLAMYSTEMDFPHRVDFWQYTESGSVPGIEGDVDIDLMFHYG